MHHIIKKIPGNYHTGKLRFPKIIELIPHEPVTSPMGAENFGRGEREGRAGGWEGGGTNFFKIQVIISDIFICSRKFLIFFNLRKYYKP